MIIPRRERGKRKSGWCPCGCGNWVDRSKNLDRKFFRPACAVRDYRKNAKAKKKLLDAHGGDEFLAGL